LVEFDLLFGLLWVPSLPYLNFHETNSFSCTIMGFQVEEWQFCFLLICGLFLGAGGNLITLILYVWGKLALPDNIIYDILAIYTEEVASILHTFHKKHFMELVGL
jgi:hypothetical protein